MTKFLRIAIPNCLLIVGMPSFASAPALVTVVEDHGFLNVDLPIADVKNDVGVIRMLVLGTLGAETIGFEIDFLTKDASQSALPPPLHLGTARIRRTGPESDRFVDFLSRRYNDTHIARQMVASVDASMVGLGDVPNGEQDMKLFFYADGPEDRYAELLININFERHVLGFYEKDPDYRKALILALTHAP